jgi:hypothetical protein
MAVLKGAGMGYSSSFPVKSRRLGDRMLKFLRRHMRLWSSLESGDMGENQFDRDDWGDQCFVGPFWANRRQPGIDKISKERGGLSYAHGMNHLGFDHSGGMADRTYMMVLIKWAAQKVGRLRNGGHCWQYDGYEWEEIDPKLVDGLGLPTKEALKGDCFASEELSLFDKYCGKKKGYSVGLISAEMKRLDDLWEKGK